MHAHVRTVVRSPHCKSKIEVVISPIGTSEQKSTAVYEWTAVVSANLLT